MAFAIGVYVYASYGGPWGDSLEERIGEIVAAWTRRLAQTEEKDEAVAKFEETLAVRFDDPMQRVWASHDLGQLLVELGRYEEAIGIAESATHLKGENGEAFSIWHRALEELRREEEAFTCARRDKTSRPSKRSRVASEFIPKGT